MPSDCIIVDGRFCYQQPVSLKEYPSVFRVEDANGNVLSTITRTTWTADIKDGIEAWERRVCLEIVRRLNQ